MPRDAQGGLRYAEFGDVYDENVWRVYGFFGYRLGSRLHAEDLTQQTFERALRAWDRFDPDRGSRQTWLLVDGVRDKVNCGSGDDKATVDNKDKVKKNCDRVRVK